MPTKVTPQLVTSLGVQSPVTTGVVIRGSPKRQKVEKGDSAAPSKEVRKSKEDEKLRKQAERRARKELRLKATTEREERRLQKIKMEQAWCDEQDSMELRGKGELQLVDPTNEALENSTPEVEECDIPACFDDNSGAVFGPHAHCDWLFTDICFRGG
jgi:hypothetical protein